MHTKEPREDPLVEMGYEIRDVDFPKLRTAVIIFIAFGAFSSLVGMWMYNNRFTFFAITPPEANSGTMKRPLPAANYPLIQDNITSKTDISTLRQQETARMTSTGYNPDHKSVHIPIDRAMAIIAQRGLPATGHSVTAVIRGNTTEQNNTPVGASSASGSIPPPPAGGPPDIQPPAGGPPAGGPPPGGPPAGGPPSAQPPVGGPPPGGPPSGGAN